MGQPARTLVKPEPRTYGLFFVRAPVVLCLFFSGRILGVGCLLLLALQILARFFDLPLLLLRSLALLLKLIFHTFPPFRRNQADSLRDHGLPRGRHVLHI